VAQPKGKATTIKKSVRKAAKRPAAGRGAPRGASGKGKRRAAAVAAPTVVSWMLKEPEEAQETVVDAIEPVKGTEVVALVDCVDRVLAEDVKSKLTLPPVDRSERDGYAVRSGDCGGERVSLKQVGIATAGNATGRKVGAGECLRIATGAVLPPGADAVVMFEDATAGAAGEGTVSIKGPVGRWQWVAKAGSDIAKGTVVVPKGEVLSPPRIAALGALGLSTVKVLRRPRAIVFTTGDEVRNAGEKLRPGDVYDGNTAALTALLRHNGLEAVAAKRVPDTLAAQVKALKAAAAKYDAVVFTGGTSVGDHDFARRALDACGTTLVHGVNLKPGKPLLFGMIGKVPVFGLPGFPVSAMMLAYVFVVPAVHKLAGYPQPYEAYEDIPLAMPVKGDKHKMFVLPVRIDEHGHALPTFRGSAEISSISSADGYITIPAGEDVYEEGTEAPVRLM
jgi:molybdopterin molybdotransferase